MTKTWMIIALIPVALGSVASVSAQMLKPARSMQCAIRATHIPGGVRLEGVVHGTPGAAGSYRLTLEKSGADDVSKVGQGGAFTVMASGASTVAMTELSLGSGDTYRADMSISGRWGEAKCAQSRAYR